MIRMASLILASASPRRAELLEQLGVSFEVEKADIDESLVEGESASDYVARLAREKSAAVDARMGGRLPVLAADTCVVLEGDILGKPVDAMDALGLLVIAASIIGLGAASAMWLRRVQSGWDT